MGISATADRLPPGPRFAALQAARFVRGPVAFLESMRRRYGDVFTVPFPFFERLVYLADPESIKQVFKGDPRVFHAGEGNAGPLGPVVGDRSVFVLDEDEHMRERKLLLPPFHGEAVRGYRELMAEIAAREVEHWPVGRPFALRGRTQPLTLEVILRAVFGIDDEEALARYRALGAKLGEVSNLVVLLPALRRDLGRFSPWGRFLRVRNALDELIYGEIARRRADSDAASRDDVLSLLLQARREDGSPMTDVELRDELVTTVAAGHETTATGLAWLFERLLRHPDVEERLRASLADGDDSYLDAVVKETLRVRPVVVDVVRGLTQDTEIADWRLPAGTYVVPAIALVHLREDVYDKPHEFRPERFLDGGAGGTYTWIPFGGGVRRCIGAAFAMEEMKVVTRTILEHARLRADRPRSERQRARHVTLVPSRGGRVVLEERLA